jgi:hypothetical protein
MSPTDLRKWALLAEMARERFPEDADMSQALVLAAHIAHRQWAGAEGFTAMRKAVNVAEETEARAAEAARGVPRDGGGQQL